MDNDSLIGFLFGLVIGVFLTLIVIVAIREQDLDACRKEHNVYFCKTVTVVGKP